MSGALREPPEALGQDVLHFQRELTGLREAARFQQLDVALRALPVEDMRRATWLNLDRFSITWVSVWPAGDCRVTNSQFAEIAARYSAFPAQHALVWWAFQLVTLG